MTEHQTTPRSDPAPFRRVNSCRTCGSTDLALTIDLGPTPLANRFISPSEVVASEPRFPLELMRCTVCGLSLLSVVVRPEILFRKYLYSSSASRPMIDHFRAYAAEIAGTFAPPGSLAVEMGSNDGVLLRPLSALGIRTVGVEPAQNLAEQANRDGVETWNEFFGPEVARRIRERHGPASAILANNVLAHIDDLGAVLEGVDILLDGSGALVVEVPYLVNLLDQVEYDTVYHEHLSYFAIEPLIRLFGRADLEIFDVARLAVHGGSLRVFVGRRGRHSVMPRFTELVALEQRKTLRDAAVHDTFAARVRASKEALVSMLTAARADGLRVAALGATAKGNTLLNYCQIDTRSVEYVADSTPMKHGLLTPGTRIPVRPESVILTDRPDLVLLLAWNYATEIVQRFEGYVGSGGRFIHPVPLARLLPA